MCGHSDGLYSKRRPKLSYISPGLNICHYLQEKDITRRKSHACTSRMILPTRELWVQARSQLGEQWRNWKTVPKEIRSAQTQRQTIRINQFIICHSACKTLMFCWGKKVAEWVGFKACFIKSCFTFLLSLRDECCHAVLPFSFTSTCMEDRAVLLRGLFMQLLAAQLFLLRGDFTVLLPWKLEKIGSVQHPLHP